jgi:peptide-methionine (S)-S-oxide reductase
MGGSTAAPTYEDVCRGTTGHIEVVEISYDPAAISYRELLDVFWQLHDPTSLDDQGPYEQGSQYRAVIFTHDADQASAALESRAALAAKLGPGAPIVTELRPASTFWPAEDYHQQYIAQGGEHHCHVFTRQIQLPQGRGRAPESGGPGA